MRRYDEKHTELVKMTKKKSEDEKYVMKEVSLMPSKPSPLLSRPGGNDAEVSEQEIDLGGHDTFEEVDSEEEADKQN